MKKNILTGFFVFAFTFIALFLVLDNRKETYSVTNNGNMDSRFKDSNFYNCVKEAVYNQPNHGMESDGYTFKDSALKKVTKIICKDSKISNTAGLEYMQELITLTIINSSLQGIDLYNNLKLKEVDLSKNNIKSIDLTKNTQLNRITLTDNNLSSKPPKCTQIGSNCDFGYIVVFKSNGGSIVPKYNGYTVKKPNNPTKSGYTFAGWYLDNNFTTRATFPITPRKNMTLYAKWIRETMTEEEENTNNYKPAIISSIIIAVIVISICLVYLLSSKSLKNKNN